MNPKTETRPAPQTFVDNAGRPVNPDEVREVKPIDLQTPQQLLAKAEEKLKEANEKIDALEAKVADAVADAKTAVDLADHIGKSLESQQKRSAEFAAQRDTWKRRSEKAEADLAQYDKAAVDNIVRDRNALRGEVAAKDKRIAQLDQAVGRLNDNVAAAVRQQREADQRTLKIQETYETMQRARDLAQEREAVAKNDHVEACKTIALMHAAAVGKMTGPKVGVVEDVKEVRVERDRLKIQVESLLANAAAAKAVTR